MEVGRDMPQRTMPTQDPEIKMWRGVRQRVWHSEEAEAAETQLALALSSAQLPSCAPLSSDSASSPALQHPHHQPPAAHRPTPAAQQRLL